MRRRGENISGKRLRFKAGLQRELIRKIKERSGLTWDGLAEMAGVSAQTLRIDWGEENSTIPYKTAKKLVKKYQIGKFSEIRAEMVEGVLSSNWGQKVGGKTTGGRRWTKKIDIPEKSEELAELFGAILGDGYIGKNELTIACAIHEKEYLEYIRREIRKLFGIETKIFASYTNKNTIILDCYSRELVKFLTGMGLTAGNKIRNRASLPKWILERTEFVYGALRGLVDTDGGIYYKQKGYRRAIIEFQTMSPSIRKGIVFLLKKTGFTPSKSFTISGYTTEGHDIRVQDQEEVLRFFRLVGSSNPKNIVKFKYFVKRGYVPSNKDIYEEITNYAGEIPYKAVVV